MRWIQTPENSFIKEIKKIIKQPKDKIFLEGKNLIESALFSDYIQIENILLTKEFITKEKDFYEALQSKNLPIIGVSERVSKEIAQTVTAQGIFAVGSFKIKTIENLSIKNPTLVVVVDRIQDPGNFGTIIRACEAFGAEAILFTPGTCSPLSTKVLRASAGSIFFIPVVKADVKEIEKFIVKNGLIFIITEPSAKYSLHEIDFTKPLAIAFGNESQGVSSHLRAIKHISCRIPHKGKTESLNVAMSATVFFYEVLRQRYLK